jgi:enoyl-CoA hydratase/carnithine racemase
MAYDGYTAVRVAVDRGVAFVTIDYPPINLLDLTLIGELDRAGRELEADPAVKVVVLQSANRDFFVAHADVTLIQRLPAKPPPRSEKLGFFHVMVDRFRTMPKATIAKIEGRCRGGGSELALSCDMRFAALGTAVLGQPEVGIGIIPGGSGSVRLPRLVGRGRALEIILGAGDFDAATAERYGYVNRALPASALAEFVATLARRIATFPADAIALAKEAVALADAGLEDALVREEAIFFRSVTTDGARRRMAAALDAGLQTAATEMRTIDELWRTLENA